MIIGYGEMLMRLKKYIKAKEVFEEYLTFNPGDIEVRGLLQKAVGVLEKARNLGRVAGQIT